MALCLVVAFLGACGSPNRAAKKLEQDAKQADNFDNRLTFKSVTLEQFDQEGNLWWKVNAQQAIYTKEDKQAEIKSPQGEFYQDGKAIIKAKAEVAEVRQDGKAIILKGNIEATDLRDGLVLKGDELEWQPEAELLVVRNSLTGQHRQMQMRADAGRYLTRKREVELTGNVHVVATESNAHVKSDKITWLVEKQLIQSDRPLQLARFRGTAPAEQANAKQGEFNLKTRVATLRDDARVALTKPPIQIAGSVLEWNMKQQVVQSSQPVTVVDTRQQLTMTGNQGNLNMKTNRATLVGDVRGVRRKNPANFRADRFIWNMTSQQFLAEGNVTFQQADPPLNLKGPKATGRMAEQVVVVSGGRVETQFIP